MNPPSDRLDDFARVDWHAAPPPLETDEAQTVAPPAETAIAFLGPIDEPDRYELLGDEVRTAAGVTWRARRRTHLPVPIVVSVSTPDLAGRTVQEAGETWQSLVAFSQRATLDRTVRLYEALIGPAMHARGAAVPDAAQVVIVEKERISGPSLRAAWVGPPVSVAELRTRLDHAADVCTAITAAMPAVDAGIPLDLTVSADDFVVTAERGVLLDPRPSTGRQPGAAGRRSAVEVAYFCITGLDAPADPADRRASLEHIRRALHLRRSFVRRVLDGFRPAADTTLEPVLWMRRVRADASRRPPRLAIAVALIAATLLVIGAAVAVRPQQHPPVVPTSPVALQALMPNGPSSGAALPAGTWWRTEFPAFRATTVTGTGKRSVPFPAGAKAGTLTISAKRALTATVALVGGGSGSDEAEDLPAGYFGMRTFGLEHPDEAAPQSLSIASTGSWTVTFRDFDALARLPVSGRGDSVYFVDLSADVTVARYSWRGSGKGDLFDPSFRILLAGPKEARALPVYFVSGPGAGQTEGTTHVYGGPTIVTIQTAGDWTLSKR